MVPSGCKEENINHGDTLDISHPRRLRLVLRVTLQTPGLQTYAASRLPTGSHSIIGLCRKCG